MTRIERVARAIAAVGFFPDDWTVFTEEARAAVAAIEQDEPTAEMIEVGAAVIFTMDHNLDSWEWRRRWAAAIYKAMRAEGA